jgi:Mrp family chromosome partitioning ATPase
LKGVSLLASCDSCSSRQNCSSATEGGSCSDDTQSNNQNSAPALEQPHELASVKTVIGVCSGKGGVGKSMVTSLLARNLMKKGYTVGILDADITGPSIPTAFGLKGTLKGSEQGIFPAQSHNGVQIVSVNLMLENPEAPVLWRGPIISGIVKQFWTDVIWDGLDVLLIDMPPGTGDVPLTVFQSMPLDGLFIVSTPQDLVSMIVKKARNMALMMQVKVTGFVENMSYVKCADCDHKIEIFGPGKTQAAADEMNVPLFDRQPIDPALAQAIDSGKLEEYDNDYLSGSIAAVEEIIKSKG